MPDEEQLDRFKQALEEKNEAAEARAQRGARNPRGSDVEGDQAGLHEAGTPQDTSDARKKSSGHGHVTGDK